MKTKPIKQIEAQELKGRILVYQPEDLPAAHSRLARAEEPPRLRDYWHILVKHRWKIAASLLTALFLASIYVSLRRPVFTARATLFIERRAPQVVEIKQVLADSTEVDDTSFYQSQYEILKSRSLAAEVIRSLRLDRNPGFAGSNGFSAQASQDGEGVTPVTQSQGQVVLTVDPALIDRYEGMLHVEPIKRSRLVKIAITSPDPVLSAEMTNAHAQAFIQQGMKLRSQASQEARKFLESKLVELKSRVQQAEKALNEFRRSKGIVSLDEKENIVVDRLADLNKRLTEAEAERIGLEAQARLIRRRDYDSLPAVIGNVLIQTLKGQLVTLEGQAANLANRYKDGYPPLAQLKSQIEETRQRLAAQMNSVVESINSAYLAAAAKEGELRSQMEKQKTAALALKDATVDYAILSREADTNNQLYDSVLERLKEISVAGEIPSSNISILDAAEVPRQPSGPQKKIALLFAIAVGLLAGLGYAFAKEIFDNTLKTPADVERYLRLANLAVVPDYRSLTPAQTAWSFLNGRVDTAKELSISPLDTESVAGDRRLSMVTESYRKLRTAIFFSQADEPPKTLLVTSATTKEGKTITAVNTSIMLAQMGLKVLLIDADLRRPCCDQILDVWATEGLSDYLVGQDELDKIISPTKIPNLALLSSGTIPPNPPELLGSKRMREMLEILKHRFDFVVIDAPPVIPVTDPVVVSTMVDGVLLVIGGQQTPRDLVQAAVAQLCDSQARILGVVLNRVDMRSAEYTDYFRYNYGTYYSRFSNFGAGA